MRRDPGLAEEYRQFSEVSAWRVRAPEYTHSFNFKFSVVHVGTSPRRCRKQLENKGCCCPYERGTSHSGAFHACAP